MPLCGAMLAVALVVAVWCDLKWRIIPNRLNLAIMAAAPLAWYAQGLSLSPDIAVQMAAAGALFAFFLVQFQFNLIGGGDVKLIGAMALWIAPSLMVDFVIAFALIGGLVSLAMLAALKLRGKPAFEGGVRLRLPDEDTDDGGVPSENHRYTPYGLAIAAAGWWVIYQQYFNHFLGMSPN